MTGAAAPDTPAVPPLAVRRFRSWTRRRGPRLFARVPDEEYHRHRALSSSGARALLPPSCPARFAYDRDHGRAAKRIFDVGHAAHAKVLGFGAELAVVQTTAKDGAKADAEDYRTKSAQDHRDEIRAAGGVPLLRAELDVVDGMAAAIRAHPFAGALFDPKRGGKPEVSILWHDPEFGVDRRARLDWLPGLSADGRLIVPDYKSTASAERRAVEKSIASYRYDQQDDWYRAAIRALGLADDADFVFVFQEKTPPFLITVVELDLLARRAAREANARALEVFAECTAHDTWPGYSDDVELVSLPPWLLNRYQEIA